MSNSTSDAGRNEHPLIKDMSNSTSDAGRNEHH